MYREYFDCTTSESLFDVDDQTSNFNARMSEEESQAQEWKKAMFWDKFLVHWQAGCQHLTILLPFGKWYILSRFSPTLLIR
jgi:hypothetical protein